MGHSFGYLGPIGLGNGPHVLGKSQGREGNLSPFRQSKRWQCKKLTCTFCFCMNRMGIKIDSVKSDRINFVTVWKRWVYKSTV